MLDTPTNQVPDFLVCHKCGKAILSVNPQRKYWLIRKDGEFNVVRCPEHLTEWALRKAGIARTRKNMKWLETSKILAREEEQLFVI